MCAQPACRRPATHTHLHFVLLQSIEMGANPAVEDDNFMAAVEALRAARPGISVHWRSADQQAATKEEA